MNSLKELQRNWEGLAQADPLWAICTDPSKSHSRWTSEDLFATGRKEVEVVLGYANRIGLCIDKTSPGLDFGCGIGRLTRALAEYFPECCGVDISPTMIHLAQELNRDLPNCRFLLNEVAELRDLPENYFGFIYTSIVLQHIAAPHSHKYIAELVRVLKPGGMLIFQLPEELRANRATKFRMRLALRSRLQSLFGVQKPCGMQMHCITESVIRKLIAQNRAQVLDVQITNSCEPSFSGDLQYLAQEPRAGYVSKQYCVIKHRQGHT
ncbi:MAG TPA: class I SAM-dependent methyltransferase [Candidatus Dormibacteraeota bacterium]|jgi:ubiquinone/menaquinone biosynthesis C-methylase UbiE|nr:class I SAM-dependent methyltransferase [Candidatus Dormibacteraeota bacterium]